MRPPAKSFRSQSALGLRSRAPTAHLNCWSRNSKRRRPGTRQAQSASHFQIVFANVTTLRRQPQRRRTGGGADVAGPPRPARIAALSSRHDLSRRRESPQLSTAVGRQSVPAPMGGRRTDFAQLKSPACRPSCPPALGPWAQHVEPVLSLSAHVQRRLGRQPQEPSALAWPISRVVALVAKAMRPKKNKSSNQAPRAKSGLDRARPSMQLHECPKQSSAIPFVRQHRHGGSKTIQLGAACAG